MFVKHNKYSYHGGRGGTQLTSWSFLHPLCLPSTCLSPSSGPLPTLQSASLFPVTYLFAVLFKVFMFWVSHPRESIYHLTCVWLISRSITASRCIHFSTNDSRRSLLKTEMQGPGTLSVLWLWHFSRVSQFFAGSKEPDWQTKEGHYRRDTQLFYPHRSGTQNLMALPNRKGGWVMYYNSMHGKERYLPVPTRFFLTFPSSPNIMNHVRSIHYHWINSFRDLDN